MRVAVKPRSRKAVRRQVQGLTAIAVAEAKLVLPSGEAPPAKPRYVVAAHRRRNWTCPGSVER
jgi:hypothetical protein